MKVRIYTDGACSGNPGPGGWAAVILLSNDKQEISGHEIETTNNRMELRAVLESLRLAVKICTYSTIDIYSDSAYVVNAVEKGWLHKWKWNQWRTVKSDEVKNKDLWVQLEKLLYKHNNVTLFKVKGHNGNKYNEICDKLAKAEVLQAKIQ